MNVLR